MNCFAACHGEVREEPRRHRRVVPGAVGGPCKVDGQTEALGQYTQAMAGQLGAEGS